MSSAVKDGASKTEDEQTPDGTSFVHGSIVATHEVRSRNDYC